MTIHVLKFGGTSLNSKEKLQNILKIVSDKLSQKIFPILVVSAAGRLGDSYATDTLIKLISEKNNREKARVISCGEIISASVVADYLMINNIKSLSLSSYQIGIYTDNKNIDSEIKQIDTSYIRHLIEQNIIPIVAGFQGINTKGEIATLGRGGSDLTAVSLAVALKADLLEIYKEVNGVFTGDPTIINNAQLINEINFNEIFEISSEGAKVISKKAAETAYQFQLPITIKNADNESSKTKIYNFKPQRAITSITSKKDIIFISINVKNKQDDLNVFAYISEFGISADFIDIRDNKITFIADRKHYEKLYEILSFYEFDFSVSEEFVKISLVGAGMTGIPGVMAKIISALKSQDIELYQTTDSHTTISCLIKAFDHNRAIKILHKTFFEN